MSRLSSRFPALLLGLATLCGAVGVVEAWRGASSNRATAEGVLRDYGAVAAWTFGDRALPLLEESAHTAFAPLWSRRRGTEQTFRGAAGFRKHAMRDECGCDRRFRAAYHFRLPLDGATPEFAGHSPSAASSVALAAAVVEDASRLAAVRTSRPFRVVSAGGETVVYALELTGSGALVAWGFALDPAAVATRIGAIMTACPLLPPVLIDGRSNEEVVAITLLAPDGSVLYASGAPEARLLAEHRLPDRMGGIAVQASVLPGVAGDLIIGGLPSSRVPLMIGVFTLAAILAGVAVAQLRRAQELARLRSDFVAGVSHELRTPLAQIRLYADTLALGRADAQDRRVWSVDGLRRETTRLEHLVDNILQFARAAGPTEASAAPPLDVSDAVSDAVESYRPLALRHARIEFDGEPDLHVRTAPDAVRQIVGNLLDNAVKYGPRGQTIEVRVRCAGTRARIEVEDQGPGVPAAERDAVWGMYRRGTRAAGSEVGGSGIGLAVVRRIVEAHGGEVRIEDAAGGAARFVIELPLEPAAIPPHVIPHRTSVAVAD